MKEWQLIKIIWKMRMEMAYFISNFSKDSFGFAAVQILFIYKIKCKKYRAQTGADRYHFPQMVLQVYDRKKHVAPKQQQINVIRVI